MVAHNRRSAKTHSGIWRDLAVRKRPTEVDAQLGPVVEIVAAHGVATPITARLIELLHDIESGRRYLSFAMLDKLEAARTNATCRTHRDSAAYGKRVLIRLTLRGGRDK